MMPHETIKLTSAQIVQAAELLARAFHDDPVAAYLFPENKRAPLLARIFGVHLRNGLRYGEVYTTPAVDGVAVWLKPDNTGPSCSSSAWRYHLG